jgi:FKBP-type peptidyl-prolyl cis-trans isomerase
VVTVNYEGRHLNGEVFDSSYKRNKPLQFPLNRVIKGWTEGLQLMQEGAKYQLYIPANLAYGTTGAGRSIGPEETLIFDVELIKVGR